MINKQIYYNPNEPPDKIRIRNETAKNLNNNIMYRKYIHKLCTLNENSNHSNSKLRILAFGPVRQPSSGIKQTCNKVSRNL